MFVKNVLRAFNVDTKITVFMRTDNDPFGNIRYKELDYDTVEDFMNDGLMTYMEVDEDIPFYIMNNTIVIYVGCIEPTCKNCRHTRHTDIGERYCAITVKHCDSDYYCNMWKLRKNNDR